jgi:hypothetical protein
MNTNKQKTNLILDALLFAGFLITFALDWTGLLMHQWIGICGGLLATCHLILHWDWVSAVTRRFFGKTSVQARKYYLLDVAIMTGFYLIVVTGLVISTWLNLSLTNYAAWSDVHVTASIVTLGLIVLKIGLHWRWIVRVARQSSFLQQPQSAPVLKTVPALKQISTPVATSGTITRRDFLRLMGTVGVASLIAVCFPLLGNEEAQAATTTGTTGNESTSAASTGTTDTSNLSSSTSSSSGTTTALNSCTVQCFKRCSFPGGCHRYQDTNGNALCDFGECA